MSRKAITCGAGDGHHFARSARTISSSWRRIDATSPNRSPASRNASLYRARLVVAAEDEQRLAGACSVMPMICRRRAGRSACARASVRGMSPASIAIVAVDSGVGSGPSSA
jgi:hypothetical protein